LLYDVEFPVNSTTGYVSGETGKLLKTTDGGNTWISLGSFNKDIMAMSFPIDNQTGYLATAYQRIYKTTDGGTSWNLQHDGNFPQASMADILFPFDSQTGFALSSTGGQSSSKILKTTDGGNNWTITDAGTTSVLSQISFPTPLKGYIAADGVYGNNPSIFLKTTDGGSTWNSSPVPYGYSLTSLCFPNGVDTGYVVGNMSGAILKTTNGGGIITSVDDLPLTDRIPDKILIRNYPNPFTDATTISWILPQNAHVYLKVYDLTTREVITLMDGEQEKGEHSTTFYADGLPAGVYYYQLRTEKKTETRKMIYLK
jgi:photosystem II stability/assembly factor-like uncharacterized protein